MNSLAIIKYNLAFELRLLKYRHSSNRIPKSIFVFKLNPVALYIILTQISLSFSYSTLQGPESSNIGQLQLKKHSRTLHIIQENTCRKEIFSYRPSLKNTLLLSQSRSCSLKMTEVDIKYPSLQRIGVLNNNNILIKNKEKVERLLSVILGGKFDELQLVVDFDYTLTRGHFNNEKSHCSWGILDNSSRMPPFYREKALELLQKYYPIEIDANKSEEEKIPHMKEWYLNIAELLKKCRLSKEILREMVAESNVKFRYDTEKLLQKLQDKNVPVLIFSAGMGDVLEHVLWHFDVYSKNVRVVSNFFKYNDEGIMVDFTGELIHMFNKNENVVHSSNYFESLKHRTNVILMGDSLGDAKMAFGVPESSNVLKIGFYNHNTVSERIDAYTRTFDIVLVNDQTMSVANSILAQIKH